MRVLDDKKREKILTVAAALSPRAYFTEYA
jgi:hypothetical protein